MRLLRPRPASLAFALLLLTGCGSTPQPSTAPRTPLALPSTATSDAPGLLGSAACRDLALNSLPDGSAPGPGTPYPAEDPVDFLVSYGDGPQQVVVAKGREAVREYDGSLDDFPGDYPGPIVEGSKRVVRWIGDPPFGTAQIRFVVDRCPYIVFVNPDGDMSGKGITDRQLRQYAKDL